ncbi:MAG: nucleotide sugar dehydrogenase [Bacilli bacterium]|nr:nucleotide sugar dehydrogenase [Bacilli bacterium]
MKIAIAGAGYVGLSLGTLLSVKNEVSILDVVPEKVDMINKRISPIEDKEITEYFTNKKLKLFATLDYKEAFTDAKYIIISTPTDYNSETNYFDTSSVEDVIEKVLSLKLKTTIIIKSTIPVGYTESIKKKYKVKNIIFSPEFLREGKALYDNLYPSRIIVGSKTKAGKEFGELLKKSSLKKDVIVKYMNSTEAESVKLFSNTYLALRVAYFNELDTYAELNELNTKDIIDGVCLDPRIGSFYNNPSFGYGGYCLPKDTKQLLANYQDKPQNLIEAIVKSNDTRKSHIANMIIRYNPEVVGVYRLNMKKGSMNHRSSAIIDVISILKEAGINIMIYEPTIKVNTFMGFEVVHDLKLFKDLSNIILANRKDQNLDDVEGKIYTRDIFSRD